ncbi:MAG: macro domain-containing protein [Kiritimatiellia bacterium]
MIKVIQGDITTLAVDAIVNAANQVMLGVRCPTGEARITSGFKLPAKFVIHTVGPVYRDGQHGESEKLAACYRNSLALAAENGCKSIVFPCISTGVYGYPVGDAAKIAVREVGEFLSPAESTVNVEEMEVIFCCFSERDKKWYERVVQ